MKEWKNSNYKKIKTNEHLLVKTKKNDRNKSSQKRSNGVVE